MPRKKLPERKNSVIKVGIYDTKHKQQLQQRAKQVQQLYRKAIDKITKAAQPSLFGGDPAREFHFSDFPALNKEVDKFIQEMGAGLQSNMEQGDKDAWTLSNTKNDAMVDYMAGAYSGDLPKETLQQWKHPHLEALDAFMKRREAGMNLSNGGNAANKLIKGVWNLEQFKGELELALEMGIGQGKSAAELSKDVRQFLKYPDKLFRRVRDKDGVLRLSKAAKAFHPGRGVYRSSYKNALRLTATENNIAYRTCDNERWNDLPFVLGQEIRTSNNHTSGGHDLVDICDELAGRYPVEFKFTGWHPWCRCYAVSILADEKEMDEYCRKIANGEDVSGFQFTGKQTEMPDEWNEWMKANKDRIEEAQAKGRQMPYFIKDNFKDGDPTKELRWIGEKKTAASATTTPAKPKKLTPKEIGDKRHAERTAEERADIQRRWNVSRSDARIITKARRTIAIAERYPSFNISTLQKAVDDLDVIKAAKITSRERKRLVDYAQVERRALEAKLKVRLIEIDATRIQLGEDVANGVIRNLKSTNRQALSKAKKMLAGLEESLKPSTGNKAAQTTGYKKSSFAITYEKKAAAWTEAKTYKYVREEERILQNGKKYKCNIYETKGGTLIVEPKKLPKTYHLTVEDVADALEKLPVELKAQAKEIHLLDFYNPDDAYWQKVYKNFTHSYATGGLGTIRFYKCKNLTHREAIADLPRTLSHENGHSVDHQMGKALFKQDISATKEWKDAMAADLKVCKKKSPTSYGENALTEDFAESCHYLIVHRKQFEKDFPNRYKILQKLLGI